MSGRLGLLESFGVVSLLWFSRLFPIFSRFFQFVSRIFYVFLHPVCLGPSENDVLDCSTC